MEIEKRGTKWRIRYTDASGKRRSVTVDHKPTKKEAGLLISQEKLNNETLCDRKNTFAELAEEYLETNYNILSPNTRRGYKTCLKRLSGAFSGLLINDIDQITVQREINRLAPLYTPKTVLNTHGFISAVLQFYRPDFVLRTKLPQKEKKDFYCPTDEDIKRILDMARPTRYYVAFCLGVMGMRRGEICALTPEDLDGNTLTISKAVYTDERQSHGIKAPKTTDSTRKLYIPDELAYRIRKDGCIYDGAESRLWASLSDMQEILGIHHFRFHDLRVYFATYAHLMGLPDKVIQDTAGWRSDYTMKKIYRKTQEEENAKGQQAFMAKMGIF